MKILQLVGAILIFTTASTVSAINPPISGCVSNDVGLTLTTATLEVNNLGGWGPDQGVPEEMRFKGVGQFDGKTLDLVAKIKEDETYQPANTANNGLMCGIKENGRPDTVSCTTGAYFAQINMRRNRETTVVFEIQDQETGDLVTLPGFVFSVFDIDEGVKEHYRITDWDTAQYDPTSSEAKFAENDYDEEFCHEFQGINCLYAHSTRHGKGCDNPTDPFDLGTMTCEGNTVDQKARSFQVTFVNKNKFELFFWYQASEGGNNGRNVVFSFNSAHSDDCPTISPASSPIRERSIDIDDEYECPEDL